MRQIYGLLATVAGFGLLGACSSDNGTGVVPVTGAPAQAGMSSASGGTSAAAGTSAGGTSAGGTGGASGGSMALGGSTSSGGTGGGAPTCSPACSADQACVEGTCMPKPVQLTQVSGCGTMYLALNNGTLYFTDSAHGKVSSIPVAGGNVTDVATGQKAPIAIAVDGTAVYWSNSGTGASDNSLMMKTTAGTPVSITTTTKNAGALTLDGKGALYYGDGDDLLTVDAKAGSTPTKLGTFTGGPTAIVLTDTRIFTALTLDNSLQWRSITAGSSGCVDPIARPVGSTTGGCAFEESQGNLLYDSLTLESGRVIWANGSLMQSADTTLPATMQGSGHTIASTESFDNISGFTSNATTVYFGEATTGIIEKAPLPDGDPVILVEDPTNELAPSSFVMDAQNVYWRTQSCAIMKLPL